MMRRRTTTTTTRTRTRTTTPPAAAGNDGSDDGSDDDDGGSDKRRRRGQRRRRRRRWRWWGRGGRGRGWRRTKTVMLMSMLVVVRRGWSPRGHSNFMYAWEVVFTTKLLIMWYHFLRWVAIYSSSRKNSKFSYWTYWQAGSRVLFCSHETDGRVCRNLDLKRTLVSPSNEQLWGKTYSWFVKAPGNWVGSLNKL